MEPLRTQPTPSGCSPGSPAEATPLTIARQAPSMIQLSVGEGAAKVSGAKLRAG